MLSAVLSFKEQPAANRIAFGYRLNRIPHIPKRNTLQAFPVSFIQRYPNTNQVPPGFPGNRPWQITKNGNPENRISVRNKKERETGFEHLASTKIIIEWRVSGKRFFFCSKFVVRLLVNIYNIIEVFCHTLYIRDLAGLCSGCSLKYAFMASGSCFIFSATSAGIVGYIFENGIGSPTPL